MSAPTDDKVAAIAMRRRAARVRAAAAALAERAEARGDASLLTEMLARQAELLRGGAEALERRALEIEPPDGVA